MSEVVTWSPPSRDVVDGWAATLPDVAELSRIIAGTEFVPDDLRGRPAAVGAAILSGRELGIGPMTALQQLNVIKGRPSMSALLMRALVQSHGHRIRVVEMTSSRCVMVGRRGDDDPNDEPTRVAYTLDDAKLAGLLNNENWRKRPRAMLLARATGELCRAAFADVIVGIPYTSEELASETPEQIDGGDPADVVATADATAPARRTIARKTAVRKPSEPAPQPEPAPVAQAPAEPAPEPQPPAQPPGDVVPGEPLAPRDVDPDNTPASREQQRLVFKLLGDLGAGEPRERRIEVVQSLIARRVESLAQISMREASVLIDTLTRCAQSQQPAQYLDWLVNSGLDHLRLVEAQTSGDELPDADVRPFTNGDGGDPDDVDDDPTADPGFDDDAPR